MEETFSVYDDGNKATIIVKSNNPSSFYFNMRIEYGYDRDTVVYPEENIPKNAYGSEAKTIQYLKDLALDRLRRNR